MKFTLCQTSNYEFPPDAPEVEINTIDELKELQRDPRYPLIINFFDEHMVDIKTREIIKYSSIEIYDDWRE